MPNFIWAFSIATPQVVTVTVTVVTVILKGVTVSLYNT
jgi:hypothetical protein